MRKFLLAATLLVPFAVAPAFAGGGALGGIAAGDVNLGMTSAGSSAGVSSVQGTQARSNVAGNGGVIVGTIDRGRDSAGKIVDSSETQLRRCRTGWRSTAAAAYSRAAPRPPGRYGRIGRRQPPARPR